jgi:Plasmid encoded RepA protein
VEQVRADVPQLVSPTVARLSIIDRRITQCTSQGLSRAATLGQLLAARWPLEQLRSRFSEFPESAFRYPEVPAVAAAASSAPPTVRAVPAKALEPAKNTAVTGAEGISFQYVPLIQCSFPHADPKSATTFTRKNGWLELTLGTTRPESGLPYGVPARLLTIYCTSEAVRTNSPEIYLGHSVHDFLRRLDVPITRGARGSLSVYANQLLRLIHSTLSIDENIRDGAGRSGLHMRQALFVEEARLWWDDPDHLSPHGKRGGRRIGNGSSLMLSSVLFHSILERSAPLATQAIKRLRKSPMDLDVYAWLVHRLFHLQSPSMISWAQLSNQFGHNYGLPRKFRHFFLDSLKRVLVVYPEAKLNIGDAGVLLLPSRPHLANSKVPAKR